MTISSPHTITTSGDALSTAARSAPDKVAFAFPEHTLTYSKWDAQSTALARALLARGFAPGDAIALVAQNCVEWPIVQIAVARAGMILVPLNTYYREEDFAYALTQSRARAVFLRRSFRNNDFLGIMRGLVGRVPACESMIVMDGEDDGCWSLSSLIEQGAGLTDPLPRVDGTDPAVIVYTSGTTGFPKGALLDGRSVMANGRLVFDRLGVGQSDRITSIVPMFHSASFCVAVSGCLQAAATFIGQDAFDPLEMLKAISAHRATVHIGVPTSYRMLLEHPQRSEFDLSSLRVGTCGGADVEPELLRRCAAEFPIPGLVQVYGLTEAAGLVTCAMPDEVDRFAAAGTVLQDYLVRIVDPESNEPVAGGAIGEVQTKSPYLMKGYHDNAQATEQAITPDGWLRCGDLGHLDNRDRLILSGGRLKDMIIRGGENIYPAEIERVLSAHPRVAEVAVFGIQDKHFGEIVGAAIRATDCTSAELEVFCAQRMAKYKIPTRYYRVDTFPLTPSGKIRKVALREMAADGKLSQLA